MGEHQPTTTVAIVGVTTVVESALAQLLGGEGYSSRLLKSSSTGVVDEQLDGVDLMVLSPALPTTHGKPSSAPCDPPRREEQQTRAYG
jgi:hypothetical protein